MVKPKRRCFARSISPSIWLDSSFLLISEAAARSPQRTATRDEKMREDFLGSMPVSMWCGVHTIQSHISTNRLTTNFSFIRNGSLREEFREMVVVNIHQACYHPSVAFDNENPSYDVL